MTAQIASIQINWKISPSQLKGKIHVPPSKSQTLRAILLAGMAHGKSTISNVLLSPDSHAMVRAIESLGATVTTEGSTLTIRGVGGKVTGAFDVIDAGNSGLVLRMITAMAALGSRPVVVTGDHSIRTQRPMRDLLQALRNLGVSAVTTNHNGYAPLIIKGPIKNRSSTLSGYDSQPVSSLLLLAAVSGGQFSFEVTNPGEKPWVDVTLRWLDRMKVRCVRDGYFHYVVEGDGVIEAFDYTVPGDISSAAFPIIAALVTKSSIIVSGVDLADGQPDTELLTGLHRMGARIEEVDDGGSLLVDGSVPLRGCRIDINDCIDTIVAFAVVGCYAEGHTEIVNAGVAREKECDRIATLREELSKMGAKVSETTDGLMIEGAPLHGATVDSHGDHRIAMGLAMAALGAEGESSVNNVDCSRKTFPGFQKLMRLLGAEIKGEGAE